jgi:hypothetical protein
MVPATGVVGDYWTRAEPHTLGSRAAKVARRLRSRTPARLYSCEAILKRLAQGIEVMACKLGERIQESELVVSLRLWHLRRG